MTTDRIDQASPDVREVLDAAYRKLFPSLRSKDHTSEECAVSDLHAFRFYRFLDDEAYTDAALMLVPEGWDSIEIRRTDDMLWHVGLAGNDMHLMAEDPDEFYVDAEDCEHLPLAICEAALRAKGPTQ
ncbi:hypothetical protein [Novosphingobium sp. MMS21-SN21R]|uniref:hypothetical protein n=1 Tax=Novosphingobium sp. MMS21-SN21R TaxID=2969298 RepID=UPI0028873508|nr:hypothetical protein [Novosphingobium sp. MMS21-SN21R]MDT0507548.1 hypothetical protein [Novosphingobium sp. MMS21-SN21R]MDT0509517.1 hypothetical protein [Novosphingobium sp. MMS21-SN21R]